MSEENINLSAEHDNDAEARIIAEKLYRIFKSYVSICFIGMFFIALVYIGLLLVVVMGLVNIFRLQDYYLKLKTLNSRPLFRESGLPLAISMLLVLTFPLAFFGLSVAMFGFARYDIYAGSDLRVTYEALEKYAENNNGLYPHQNWREELIYKEDEGYEFGQKDYVCLNLAALSLGNDMPDNMVLGFSTYEKCDAVGVYDIDKHYRNGLLWVIWGDGTTKAVSCSQVNLLRWNLEDEYGLKLNYVGIFSVCTIVILLAVGVIIKYRKIFIGNCGVIFGISLLAVLAGAALGIVSLKYYSWYCHDYYGGAPLYQAALAGGFMAGIFALAYMPLMIAFRNGSSYKHAEPWITVYGSITGILCSCAVHMVLRYICFESSFISVIAGIPFGAWAGMVIGRQTGLSLDKKHNKLLAKIEANNE